MNFHKTIGYLAALLLIVGFGVPDSFAQNEVDAITLSVITTEIQDNAAEGTADVIVSVNVTVATAPGADTDYVVTVSAPSMRNVYDSRPSAEVTVTVAENTKMGTAMNAILKIVGLKQDKDAANITVTLTASSKPSLPYSPDPPDTFEIIDIPVVIAGPPGNSVSGYRVEIVEPAEEWLGIDDMVEVRVLRRQGPSFQWGSFSSIEVELVDEAEPENGHDAMGVRTDDATAFYSMTITNSITIDGGSINQLSNLSLADVRRDTLESSADGPDAPKAYYIDRGRGHYDILEFRIPILGVENEVTNPDLSKVYAVVTFNDAGFIESRDIETKIHSAFDDVVGNGVLVKIDRVAPVADVISELTHTITNAEGTADKGAGIKDKIKLDVTVNGIFDDTSVLLEIIDIEADIRGPDSDPVTVVAANSPLDGFSKSFGAVEILNDGGEVSHEFTVQPNQFKRKAVEKYEDDEVEIKVEDLLEVDEMMVRARAQVTDKAGNKGNQYNEDSLPAGAEGGVSAVFMLDSKPPKVTIAHPDSSHKRYTAQSTQLYSFIDEGDDVVLDLNPLSFSSDEYTAGESFIIIGADSLILDGIDFSVVGVGVQENLGELLLRKKTAVAVTGNNARKHPGLVQNTQYNKGKAANLKIGVRDRVGNLGTASPKEGTSGNAGTAIFDNKAPEVERLFPNTDDLPDDLKIGGAGQTHFPVFRITEVADSILVRYEGSDGVIEVPGTADQKDDVNENIRISFIDPNDLKQDDVYDMQVYVRDLAGYVGYSDKQEGLVFDNSVVNPSADGVYA